MAKTAIAPVTLREVLLAARRLAPLVERTPTLPAPGLSALLGREVWLKLECQQRTGSFKLRGALNRLLTLPPAARERGIVTCSAGNHGLGVAAAAQQTGVAATIVVPENASAAKVAALRALGADLLQLGADYDAAEAAAVALAAERGCPFVSGYNDPAVIAGAGTIALELLHDLPDAGTIIVPVGGGGLASGIGVVARALLPSIRLVGVVPETSPAMSAALAAGALIPVTVADTLADGLAGNIAAGSITFPLVRDTFDAVVTVSETAISTAMATFLAAERLLVEGSGAVGLAALQAGLLATAPDPLVLIISGRNVTTATIAAVLAANDHPAGEQEEQ